MEEVALDGKLSTIRDPYCLGRSCLDLGPDVKATFDEKGLDIRFRMEFGMSDKVVLGSCRDMMPRLLVNGERMELGEVENEPRVLAGDLLKDWMEGTSEILFRPRFFRG